MPADLERSRCGRCGALFAPDRTRGECPLCGLEVPGPARGRGRTLLDDPDNRITLLVLGFTLANVLLLALIAVAINNAAR